MRACHKTAVVSLSVDLALSNSSVDDPLRPSLERTAATVLELLSKYEVPATWAISDPAGWTPARRVLSAAIGGEIAILADESWTCGRAPRHLFGRQLAARVQRARAAGFEISSLALHTEVPAGHAELATKLGITAVRHAPTSLAACPQQARPRMLSSGVWSFPTSLTVPGPSRWLSGDGSRKARALVDRVTADGRALQLVADVETIARGGRSSRRGLERVLRHLQLRRKQGDIEVASFRASVARLAGRYQGQPSRSILRSAA
jgi:hypothetical protein